jgi:hypothetical protein
LGEQKSGVVSNEKQPDGSGKEARKCFSDHEVRKRGDKKVLVTMLLGKEVIKKFWLPRG